REEFEDGRFEALEPDTRPAPDGGTWSDGGKCYDPPAPDGEVGELVAAINAEIEFVKGDAAAWGVDTYGDLPRTLALLAKCATALTALAAERGEAMKIARDLTKALVDLTPGGSEYFTRSTTLDAYFADIEQCT